MRPKTPSSQRSGPRFCPTCGYEAGEVSDGPLCARCGAALHLQGYCPICESRWRLAVGALCPKHDVELLSDEPGSTSRVAAGPISWITVTKFPHSLAAAAARIRLEAEGIPTFLEGERMGSPSMYRVATGGVKLQVPADLVAEARVILSQSWSLPGEEIDIDDDLDSDWQDLAPAPSPIRGWVAEAILILVLLSPAIIWLVAKLSGSR
jgi:hypothetical protein